MTALELEAATARIVERLAQLGRISDEPDGLTRTFLSPAMREVNTVVAAWMREAGLEVTRDDWGNLIGRLVSASPRAKTLVLGSHLDTVRKAGRYDGPLGVVLAIAACEKVRRAGLRLPFHLDVIGFSDEEGVRFHSAYLGSKAVAGMVTPNDLALIDEAGITLAQAVGGSGQIPAARYATGELLGYVEAHLEQGPILEAAGQAIGVVTAIAAQSRSVCSFVGRAGHAGTTPMCLRRDALAAAAEFIVRVEALARETAGLVATVGQIKVEPNVSNVIAQSVVLSLDIRHAETGEVRRARDRTAQEGQRIAVARGVTFSLAPVQETDAVGCDPTLTEALSRAVGQYQAAVPRLVSGAGHDGVVLSRIAPIAMLFVRCRDGLSHHPDEHVEPADMGLALRALVTFIRGLA